MISLPVDAYLDTIETTLRSHRRIVLCAPPGSGKTTRVAPHIAVSGLLHDDHRALVMLQPRRVAARASAARIASEQGWTLGREVGYHIRNDRRVGPDTLVRVATEGILTRQLLADPFLEGIGAVVLDEFHERSLHTDLALAMLKESADSVRDDLILVVMSATLDAEPISRYLGDCPIVQIPGRAYPVEIAYRESPASRTLPDRVAEALNSVLADPSDGDILVFLPGVEEIRRTARAVDSIARTHDLLVLPLHGSLPADEQDRALRPAPQRKVVLATNVAETSLTIDGVTTVIDSGLARIAHHDPSRGMDRLDLGWISLASATQRAGRAGRTAPGRCVRLWPERENKGRGEFDVPEIRRLDLSSTVMAVKSWGCADVSRFPWFEPPPDRSLVAAERLLRMLDATDEAGRLTDLGSELLAVPAHPRIGRLLRASASVGRLNEGAAIAALLSDRDILTGDRADKSARDSARGTCDLLPRLDALDEARRDRFSSRLRDRGIDPIACRRVVDLQNELVRVGRRFSTDEDSDANDETIRWWILLAYPDRVCRRRENDAERALMVGGKGIRLDRSSIVRDAEFFVAIDPRDVPRSGHREAVVRIASAIDFEWLGEAFPDSVRRERTVRYDESRGRAIAVESLVYHDLPLREETHGSVTAEESSRALSQWLSARAEAFVREDKAASAWLDRYRFFQKTMFDLDLPPLGEEEMQQVVAWACDGKTTLEQARRVPLVPLLLSFLSHAQARRMDVEAPEAIRVPSGNRIRLVYEPDRPPVLAVRLQELFGLAETPTVAANGVRVLLHLLGPNYRPVQITDDLRSFWTGTYFQVRKDLRNRYPKHSWPEDPWTAQPEAKGKRSV